MTAGAVAGSLALSDGDRWSDLDLTFGVSDQIPISDVLEDWTLQLVQAFQAVKLFDLPSGTSIYRVFLLPGCSAVRPVFHPGRQLWRHRAKVQTAFRQRC